MSLCLHAGAKPIDCNTLRDLETPEATATHVPIPHFRLVGLVAHSLSYYGHEVREQHHGVTPDGNRYFGVLTLRSPYTGYEDMVGLRNSHDRTFPVGIGFGSYTFVCDNTAFIADHVVRRKHTANLKRDIPGLIGEIVEPLALQREAQAQSIHRYRNTTLSEAQVDHAIMQLYRRGVVNITSIPDVWREWEEPSFDEFRDGGRTAWRLFNAVTFVLTGKVVANPTVTQQLHQIVDGFAEAA